MHAASVPFRIRLPGTDSLDLGGARTEWRHVQGTVRLAQGAVVIHWRIVRREEEFGLFHVHEAEHESPPELLEVPLSWISHARVARGWFAPTLELRAQWTDAFERVPGAGVGVLAARVARRDRAAARRLAKAIMQASAATRRTAG